MKKKIFIITLMLILSISLVGCFSNNPSMILEEVEIGTTDYGSPKYFGRVKNNGDVTLYNIKIEFKIYETSSKNNIIDTAVGFPAHLGDIEVGETANFEAIAFNLDTTNELQYSNYKITYLER